MATALNKLLIAVRSCTLCSASLPLGPRPVLQASRTARLLIAGQAPGRKVHASGLPFDDASGERLRRWLGVTRELFYDARHIAIVPMGFCYPGTGSGGDLPPRPECATAWRERLLRQLPHIELTLAIGSYAQAYHLAQRKATLTETVADWRSHWPTVLPMPHPSPRNQRWLQRNAWFEAEVVPCLQERIAALLG